MSNTAIKIENLSKLYRIGEIGTGTLSHDLNRWFARVRGKEDPFAKVGQVNDRTQKAEKGEHVWALKDINLEVKQGEVLGIIGKNGAGKSTLLKLLSRVTSPTTGTIKTKGRLASLLEVGTGFHPEMTGRENIFMNGTIMGMRKWEITKKLDEIVDFAGVAKYLDTPTKRYSSGMTVRLGFAVAAFLEPEILIVDEVLAVGDAEFQKKAIGKMRDISSGGGRTVLFVSHNMASVKALCTRTLVLVNGGIDLIDQTQIAISHYQQNKSNKLEMSRRWSPNNAPGTNLIKLLFIDIKPDRNKALDIDTPFRIYIGLINSIEGRNLGCTIKLINKDQIIVFTTGAQISTKRNSQNGFYTITFQIPAFLLNAGIYFIDIIVGEDQKYMIFNKENVINFEILNTATGRGSNMNIAPGVVRPIIKNVIKFELNNEMSDKGKL